MKKRRNEPCNFCPNKKEQGNVIDYLGSLFVVAFIFVMILAYAAYGKVTQQRLAIDNCAKEYLYRMEEYGFIAKDAASVVGHSPTIAELVDSYEAIGVEAVVDEANTTVSQVGYGDPVTLTLTATFDNPLFTTFGDEDSMFSILGFDEKLAYNVSISSTAKW